MESQGVCSLDTSLKWAGSLGETSGAGRYQFFLFGKVTSIFRLLYWLTSSYNSWTHSEYNKHINSDGNDDKQCQFLWSPGYCAVKPSWRTRIPGDLSSITHTISFPPFLHCQTIKLPRNKTIRNLCLAACYVLDQLRGIPFVTIQVSRGKAS